MARRGKPYLVHASFRPDVEINFDEDPFNIAAVRDIGNIEFHPNETFLVGENGSDTRLGHWAESTGKKRENPFTNQRVIRLDGGGGGNRTRVRKRSAGGSTCVAGLFESRRAFSQPAGRRTASHLVLDPGAMTSPGSSH